MDFDNLKVNGDTSTSDGLVVYANTVPKFVHLQVHFHEIPFKTILFISSIFPMVKGEIHYHPVWFLIETTFAYFSNHHLSKALKQLIIKQITSFTEHFFNIHCFFHHQRRCTAMGWNLSVPIASGNSFSNLKVTICVR